MNGNEENQGQQTGDNAGASDLPNESVVVGDGAGDTGATGVTLNQPLEEVQESQEQAPRTSVAGVVIKESTDAPKTNRDLVEVQEALTKGTGQMPMGVSQLVDYCNNMAPTKSQTPETSVQHQLALANALTMILASEEENFHLGMRATLSLFQANANECFAPNLRNRGLFAAGLETIDNKLMRFLTRVVDLLVITAGSKSRADAIKHVDIQKVLAAVPNVRARQNLTAFFS